MLGREPGCDPDEVVAVKAGAVRQELAEVAVIAAGQLVLDDDGPSVRRDCHDVGLELPDLGFGALQRQRAEPEGRPQGGNLGRHPRGEVLVLPGPRDVRLEPVRIAQRDGTGR